MSSSDTFVIVGAGMAGGKAVETLREEGFDGRVVLLGAEPHRPYERPPLSKDYLRGEGGPAWLQDDEGWYEQHDVELRKSTVVQSIDAGARAVVLSGGERIGFDRLLFATGAEPRRLPVEGADLDGVHLLRTIEDSDAIRATFDTGGRLVVIGGGWIGCEVAASARQKGMDVTLVEPLELPLLRVLGPELGAFYRDVHVEHGVEFLSGGGCDAIEGSGRAERVRTSDGRTIECTAVVVGIGVTPRSELLQDVARVDNGVLVDERLQSSVDGIFAAGDVANAQHPLFGRVRVEHWANALEQGPTAARAMLGRDVSYDKVPYFFSDQYDVGMEYAGLHDPGSDELVLRGDMASREFVAFWLRDERLVAGMNVNVWDVSDPIQELIRSGATVDRARLADPDVPVEEVASSAAAG
ncbi:MAG: 3-phenylpropionate/trans-cinnamate dioxygenase ferredoxin reductase component [Solirubrobacteraceae bacterium]|jgi:3-phenylpropionate/trans-cinnamate dioxygenase ferredoxin reductase subunit|nr:3-phenylpropionate/trans-cinnamate dioxygenase ferredoxin reductase component [Solirubrobacteraceae bacterium]